MTKDFQGSRDERARSEISREKKVDGDEEGVVEVMV